MSIPADPARCSNATRLASPRSNSNEATRERGRPDNSASAASNSSRLPDSSARRIKPAVSCEVARRCAIRPLMSSPRDEAAMLTVERSRASPATRSARSALSQFLATTNCASVSDNLATSATRVAAGRSSSTSIDSRIAARWPWRSTMRSQENGGSSAVGVFDQLERRGGGADFGDGRADRRPAD